MNPKQQLHTLIDEHNRLTNSLKELNLTNHDELVAKRTLEIRINSLKKSINASIDFLIKKLIRAANQVMFYKDTDQDIGTPEYLLMLIEEEMKNLQKLQQTYC